MTQIYRIIYKDKEGKEKTKRGTGWHKCQSCDNWTKKEYCCAGCKKGKDHKGKHYRRIEDDKEKDGRD